MTRNGGEKEHFLKWLVQVQTPPHIKWKWKFIPLGK